MTLQDIARRFRRINLPEGGEETQMDIAYRLYNNAILLIKAGRNNEARRDLKEAVRRYPRFDDAYMLLGLTHFACGNRIDAMKTINMISDPNRHSEAMRYYDALASGEDVTIEGEFSEAGGETDAERRRRQLEREYSYGRQVGGRQEGAEGGEEAVADLVFDPDEEDRRDRQPLSDFEKRFRAAQKSVSGVDAFDAGLKENETARRKNRRPSAPVVTPAGSASSVAFGTADEYDDDTVEEPVNAGTDGETGETEGGNSATQAGNAQPESTVSFDNDEFDAEIIPTPARPSGSENRTGRAPDPAREQDNFRPEESVPGGESAKNETPNEGETSKPASFEERVAAAKKSGRSRGSDGTETPPQPGFVNKKTAVMAVIVAACILVTAAVSALALKLHLGHINKNSPQGTEAPTATSGPETGDPVATPDPFGTDARTEDTSGTPDMNEPTAQPTEEPTPTPQGKTEAELREEASQKLSEAKNLFAAKSYYECVELMNSFDWSHLDPSLTAEKNTLAGKALATFSNEYYNLMYSNVGKEDWNAVLKYALPLIKHNPEYERGAPVYFSAGKAYDFLGDKEKAEFYYRETMARYPGTNDAEYARYRLSLLTG